MFIELLVIHYQILFFKIIYDQHEHDSKTNLFSKLWIMILENWRIKLNYHQVFVEDLW